MAEYNSPENINTEKLAKFNSMTAILFRLDLLWKDAHAHSRSGQLMKWNWDLDKVFCELSADAKPEHEETFKKFNTEVFALSRDVTKRAELYEKLMEKEIFLRKLQNKQGMGVKYEAALDEYMD